MMPFFDKSKRRYGARCVHSVEHVRELPAAVVQRLRQVLLEDLLAGLVRALRAELIATDAIATDRNQVCTYLTVNTLEIMVPEPMATKYGYI